MSKFDLNVINKSMRNIATQSRAIGECSGNKGVEALTMGAKDRRYVTLQQHMCDFRDLLWDDILKMAGELERDDKQLSHFVVGSWMMNHMKDNPYIGKRKDMNMLMGHRLIEDSHIPRDALWAMDRQCNILFKIKVEI